MKSLIVLLLSAVPAGVGVSAQSPGVTGRGDRSATTRVAQPAPSTVTTVSVSGTIDKYDPLTRMLSLSTPNGVLQFRVDATDRIRQGWHRVDAADLQKRAGNRATVRYTDSGGNKVVESVHVFGKSQPPAAGLPRWFHELPVTVVRACG